MNVNNDGGLDLTDQETHALAQLLAARAVDDAEGWLNWEDVPNLGEHTFDRVVEAVAHVAKGLYLGASAVIDAKYLFEQATSNPSGTGRSAR